MVRAPKRCAARLEEATKASVSSDEARKTPRNLEEAWTRQVAEKPRSEAKAVWSSAAMVLAVGTEVSPLAERASLGLSAREVAGVGLSEAQRWWEVEMTD
jgi:hypothetical protein